MRIARVLHLSNPHPIVAIERDGALYAAAELDRIFATKYAPDRLADASDFHTRVVALSCAGLAELDDRLRSGDRPTEARIHPGSFLWLAPCATERAMYVQIADARGSGGTPSPTAEREPSYWIGNARAFLGHDASVPFPSLEEEPDFELCIAALLRDDIYRVAEPEAERAILGYLILNAWTARGLERRYRALGYGVTRARDFASQLGPVLVTKDEIADVSLLRTQARVGTDVIRSGAVGELPFSPAESIAFVSDHIELHAGDVIGAACLNEAGVAATDRKLAYSTPVELTIERMGKLVGRPVRGPDPIVWRSGGAARPPTRA